MFDAVHVVVSAVRELNRSQEIGVKPLACTSANIWPHGTSLMNYLRMVSQEQGGQRAISLPQVGDSLCLPCGPPALSSDPIHCLLLSLGLFLALPFSGPLPCSSFCPVSPGFPLPTCAAVSLCLCSIAPHLLVCCPACLIVILPGSSPSFLSPPPLSLPLWTSAAHLSGPLPPLPLAASHPAR